MSTPVPMPPGPPPLPRRENLIQTFQRIHADWKKDIDQSGTTPSAPYVPVRMDDLTALLTKVERFAQYGANAETEALLWRVKTAMQLAGRE